MKITMMHPRRGQNVVKRGQLRATTGIGQYRIVGIKEKRLYKVQPLSPGVLK